MAGDLHQKQFEFLKNKFESGQLSHAYLLSGNRESELADFAREFVKMINCSSSAVGLKKACGECQNCKMAERGIFPDLMVIKSGNGEGSLKDGTNKLEIGVAQIRSAEIFLSYKPFFKGFKSVIIENAERMTIEAQNCFLKTLEEPRGKTVIFLISSKPGFILPTITSRCQELKFFKNGSAEPKNGEDKNFSDLQKVTNSELSEKFKYAKSANLDGQNFSEILFWLRNYFRRLMLEKIGAVEGDSPQKYSLAELKKIIRMIENINYQADLSNINSRMALEILLMEM